VAAKQDALVSGQSIKTVGGVSLLGSGDIPLPAGNGSVVVVNDFTTGGAAVAASAETVKTLKGLVDAKADASSLSSKADVSALAAKADAAAVSTALALKADSAAMTTTLAAKLDSSALAAGLATKADASATAAALAGKMPSAGIAITSSRALTLADAGATLTNATVTAYSLSLIPGLGQITLAQANTGTLTVTAGTATLSGTATTAGAKTRVILVEVTSGNYAVFTQAAVSAYDAVSTLVANVESVPLGYLGDAILWRGIPMSWASPNGKVGRYIPASGFRINGELLNNNIVSDTTTNTQYLAKFTIPGGVLQGKDSFNVRFLINCAAQFGSTSANVIIDFINESVTVPTFFRPVSSATSTGESISADFTINYANLIRHSGGSSSPFYAYSGAGVKRMSTLSDIVVQVGVQFATTGGTKTATLNVLDEVPRLTLLPASATAKASPESGYRQAHIQPFANDSFWNMPLPSGTTYEAATDPMTALAISQNPGGYTNGAYPWVQGFNGSGVSVVYLSADMPLATITYTSRAPGAPWPFKSTAVTNGSFKYPMPSSALPTGQTNDAIVVMITPDRRYCIESGGYSYNAATNTHSMGYVNVIDLYGFGMSSLYINPASTTLADPALQFMQEAYRASGHPVLGGVIRKEDIDAGVINHMLCLQLSQFQYRATVFKVVSATGTTFQIQAVDKFSADSTGVSIDYSSLFPAGGSIVHGASTYTVAAGGSTYSGGITTIPVTTTISTSATVAYLSGTQDGRRSAAIRWPATQVDSAFDDVWGTAAHSVGVYRGLVPMGAIMAIPNTVSLSTLGLASAEGLMVATAFQKYGGVCNDTAVNTFNLAMIDSQLQGTTAANNIMGDIVKIRDALRIVTNYNRTTAFQSSRLYPRPPSVMPLY
jgi:hypothetical protein